MSGWRYKLFETKSLSKKLCGYMDFFPHMIAFMALTWMGFFISNGVSRAYAHTWLDGTPRFHEDAVSLAQTLGHNDRTMLAPALAGALPPEAYEVDDEREFYATDMSNGSQYSVTASCRAVSDRAYIFVENGTPAASEEVKSLLLAFDKIYDTITGHFGPPPDSVDNDPRIYILLMDVIDDKRVDGTRIMGYFDPINQYQNDQLPRWARWTRQVSNEVEMFYIDYTALDLEPGGAEGLAAHEFTHLVQWARDPEEAIWIDEGIAVYAEAMLGYELEDLIPAFESEPDIPLLNWYDTLADYGAAYLFFAYVSEKYGGIPAIASIVKNEDQGTASIEKSLAAQGKSVSFSDLFSDWVIANYLDDPDLGDGVYGYAALDVHLKPSVIEALYPIDSKVFMIEPWAAHYIEFTKGQDDAISLTVSNSSSRADIVAQVIEYGGGIRVSSFKSDKAASGSSLVSQESQKAILVVTSQPDPPESGRRFSSYAYSAEIHPVVSFVVPTIGMKITKWGVIKSD